MIRVLLADDQELVRAGFRGLLRRAPDIEVVGECGDGLAVVELARQVRPDVVLMDIRMPGIDGLRATRRILAEGTAQVRVIILTTYELDEYIFEALRAGASGFLIKTVTPDQLRAAIRVAAAGEALLTPSVTRRVIAHFSGQDGPAGPDPSQEPPWSALTAREREVVVAVAAGLSNQEIAARLCLSPLTAKTHVSRIMTKLGLRDRAQIVVLAYQTGLVDPAARPFRHS